MRFGTIIATIKSSLFYPRAGAGCVRPIDAVVFEVSPCHSRLCGGGGGGGAGSGGGGGKAKGSGGCRGLAVPRRVAALLQELSYRPHAPPTCCPTCCSC